MRYYNAAEALLDGNLKAGRGDKIAFVDPRRSITYGGLHKESCRVANALRRLGLRHESRIAMIMLDTVDWPCVFLGALRAGVIPVALNTLLTTEQYAYVLEDSRAEVLFVSAPLFPVILPILSGANAALRVVVVGEGVEGRPTLAHLLEGEDDHFGPARTFRDEPAFWLYSSGSTGMPKGVKHVHSSLMATAEAFGHAIMGIKETDVCHSAAKFFFAYGLGNSLTFPLAAGASVVLNPERPTPAAVFALMEQHRPTIFFGVPTLYAAMLADTTLAHHAGSPALRLCASAGEALPAHVGEAWKARFGVEIVDGVGSTEMLHIYVSNKPGDIGYGTSGRPVPGYQVRLVDEAGQDVAPGEVGEMLVAGPSMAEGYWNQRDKSRGVFEGTWMRSGDKYVQDGDGRFTYSGRADDMFKVSGIWVSPFEIESALISHPAVLESAVVPAMDKDELVKPKAYVVLKEGAVRQGLEESLKEHVKAKAGLWKYPRWIIFTDVLPKTATGKIQRFKLRELENG